MIWLCAFPSLNSRCILTLQGTRECALFCRPAQPPFRQPQYPWAPAGQAGDGRALNLPGDGIDCGEIALADHRETALDHVHLQPSQLPRDLKFLAQVIDAPGHCSPSRSVVSKIKIRFFFMSLSLDSVVQQKTPLPPGSGVYESLSNKFKPQPPGPLRRSASPSSSRCRLKLAIAREISGGPSQVNRFFPNRFAPAKVPG
ncbi:MAG: hypothetical protein Ct9H300mP7_4160 [Verrucomicrobiota bacterium]|nr:MAG: hypothetical protein Ct9H300mP7_4160 [Verrucomicrobiota bacterium]